MNRKSLMCLLVLGVFLASAVPASAAADVKSIEVKSGGFFEINLPKTPNNTEKIEYGYGYAIFDPRYFNMYEEYGNLVFKALKPGQQTILIPLYKYNHDDHARTLVDVLEYRINITP